MENSIIEIKKELTDWIENTFDLEILQKILDLKRETESLHSAHKNEAVLENDFDEQFAAGMTSDELMENIAAHIEAIALDEKSSVVSDIQSEYAVKDDFDERFGKGLTPAESKKRTHAFIETLPWKK